MDIYLTNLTTKEKIRIPKLPETVSIEGNTKYISYDLINLGEAKFPKGNQLKVVSWDGELPGKSQSKAPWLRGSWKDPVALYKKLDSWRSAGRRIRLLISGAGVNQIVTMDSLTEKPQHKDEIGYSITFSESRTIMISVVSKNTKVTSKTAKTRTSSREQAKTYTVKSGDTLWKIAQKCLGKGSRYMEIYNLNKSRLSNPQTLKVGQVLTLPSS